MEPLNLEFLKQQSLFVGLTDPELERLWDFLKRKEMESDESIIDEGDNSSELYIVAEGEVAVLKWDEPKLFQLPISTLGKGEMFGEMSFLDNAPRSASVETRKHTVLYSLSKSELKAALPEMQEVFYKIVSNIAMINFQRLRTSNQSHIKTLRTSVHELRVRLEKSLFILLITLSMGLFNFIDLIPIPANLNISSLSWSWICWILLLLPVSYFIKKFHYYFSDFGLHQERFAKSINEALVLTAIGGVFIYLLHLGLTPYAPESTPQIVFHPALILLYFIYCAAYEFIARGALINALNNIIKDENGWKSIALATFIVTFIPLFSYATINFPILLLSFIANFILGKILFYQRNIVGTTLIHFILGLLVNYLRLV